MCVCGMSLDKRREETGRGTVFRTGDTYVEDRRELSSKDQPIPVSPVIVL